MTSPGDDLLVLPRSGQAVIFDLEWTAWEGSLARNWTGPGEYREVIQIGAVQVQAADFAVLDSFALLVRPVRNPILSDYIQALTGITNQRMELEGVGLGEALAAFATFMDGLPAYCNGGDAGVLVENCRLLGLPSPFSGDRFCNLRPLLAQATRLPANKLVSSDLPGLMGIEADIDRHTGEGDARAIALALRSLRERGAV